MDFAAISALTGFREFKKCLMENQLAKAGDRMKSMG
jgi:hypothetical protein